VLQPKAEKTKPAALQISLPSRKGRGATLDERQKGALQSVRTSGRKGKKRGGRKALALMIVKEEEISLGEVERNRETRSSEAREKEPCPTRRGGGGAIPNWGDLWLFGREKLTGI